MPPTDSIYDFGDGGLVDTKLVGQLLLGDFSRRPSAPDIKNLNIAQLGDRVGFTFEAGRTSSADFISNVVRVSSNIEMVGIHTRRHVAMMENVHSFGDRPIGECVRVPVGVKYGSAIPVLAVAAKINRTGPYPAIVSRSLAGEFVNTIPETTFGRTSVDLGKFIKSPRLRHLSKMTFAELARCGKAIAEFAFCSHSAHFAHKRV